MLCVVMELVDVVNVFVDIEKLWDLVKDEVNCEKLYVVCLVVLEVFCLLVVYFKLILLIIVECIEVFFNVDLLMW